MRPRPHIVLEALQVRRNPTGVGTAILELCRALAAEDRGCDFSVLAAWPEMFADCAGQPGWTVVPCEGARGGTLKKAWFLQARVPRLVHRHGGDLLHSLQFLAPLMGGAPLVTSVYDLVWLEHPDTIEWSRRLYYRLVVPGSLGKSRAVLAASRATADDLARHFAHLEDRIRVTPLGVPRWASDAGRRPSEPEGGGYFLFLGALEPRKNLVRVLDAYTRLLDGRGMEKTPDLVLAGPEGWLDGGIRGRLEDLADKGKVRTPGYCQPRDMSALFKEALALVFPSIHEGFGLPILEAMALGVPVLTSDRGAMAEVAAEAAVLVDPEDTAALAGALERLVDDPGLRRDLSAAGYDRVRTFAWASTAQATVEVYRSVLAEQGLRF